MVDEVGKPPVPVDRLAGEAVGAGDCPGAAAEHADLPDLHMVQGEWRNTLKRDIFVFWSFNLGGGWLCVSYWYLDILRRSHIAVFPLDEAEECRHVRPAEVVAGPQPGEQTPLGQPLEVVLAYVLREETLVLVS